MANEIVYTSYRESTDSSQVTGNIPSADYYNLFVKLAGMLTQTIEGDIMVLGNLYAQGQVTAYSSVPGIETTWWEDMPIASPTVLGGIKLGANLTYNSTTGQVDAVTGGTGSGDWSEITNRPSWLTYDTIAGFQGGHGHAWTQITGKPTFATVATSGSYIDLSNKPTIPSLVGYATETYVSNIVDDYLPLAGGTMTGSINMNNNWIAYANQLHCKDNGNGTIEIGTYQGILPGYPSNYYPTLKGSSNIYFAAGGVYVGGILSAGIFAGNGKQFINNSDGGGFKSRNFHGMIGDYDNNSTASKIIWTIGDLWNTIETHYGLGYAYNTKISGDHEFIIRGNGTSTFAIGLTTGNAWGAGSLTMVGNVTATKYLLANNWTIESDTNGLRFLNNGNLRGRLKNGGKFQCTDDIEAFSNYT